MTDRKHPTVAFWITVNLVVVLVGYPLSIGPWSGLIHRGLMPERVRLVTPPVYVPAEWVINNSSGWVNDAIWRYLSLWMPGR